MNKPEPQPSPPVESTNCPKCGHSWYSHSNGPCNVQVDYPQGSCGPYVGPCGCTELRPEDLL
jgi:hypothetical protein